MSLSKLPPRMQMHKETERARKAAEAERIQAEIDAMRAEYQAEIKWLSQGNDVIRRVQKEWTRGVCLIHGVYRMRDPDGSLALNFAGHPVQVEYTGSGFLVSEEGHIVTNRHVALPYCIAIWLCHMAMP